jgi:competence protein CoiA
LIWVVDGTRRKRDIEQLSNAWRDGTPIGGNPNLRKAFSDSCLLLREWSESPSPIFFDLGHAHVLWWVLARGVNGSAYMAPYSRAQFIKSLRSPRSEIAAQEFEEFVTDIPKLVASYESCAAVYRTGYALQPQGWRNRRRMRL